MDLEQVMQEVAEQLDTIDGLVVYGWPPDSVTVPGVVVTYPDAYDFDATYVRGSDEITLPVVLVVGKASARGARSLIGKFCSGDGDQSIKRVVEAGTYTAFDAVHVGRVEFDTGIIGTTEYLIATFFLTIEGKGAD
jgi:hypothetical protein